MKASLKRTTDSVIFRPSAAPTLDHPSMGRVCSGRRTSLTTPQPPTRLSTSMLPKGTTQASPYLLEAVQLTCGLRNKVRETRRHRLVATNRRRGRDPLRSDDNFRGSPLSRDRPR